MGQLPARPLSEEEKESEREISEDDSGKIRKGHS